MFDHFYCNFNIAVACDNDYGQVGNEGFDLQQQVFSVCVFKAKIAKDDIRGEILDLFQAFLARMRKSYLEIISYQEPFQQPTHIQIVIDDQYFTHRLVRINI
jgi:hypothetical protein